MVRVSAGRRIRFREHGWSTPKPQLLTPKARRCMNSFDPRRRLLRQLMRYRRAFLPGVLCVIVTTSLSLTGPWVLRYAIDDLQTALTLGKVRLYAVALLGLAAGAGLFRFLMRRIIIGG